MAVAWALWTLGSGSFASDEAGDIREGKGQSENGLAFSVLDRR